MSQPEIDSRALRNALGRFATGVAIVTALDNEGKPMGLTVNSFSAVSLEPALVLWCLDNNSHNLEAFNKASHHVINILTEAQMELSNRFASLPTDRFEGLEWQAGAGGAPVLPGCSAVFEVANETRHVSGDHTIYIGRVVSLQENPEPAPLLFYAGQYRKLAGD
jgi:flavin reductase (DIM6/NTAB) family NADH-FMN oxidoreductase RutF